VPTTNPEWFYPNRTMTSTKSSPFFSASNRARSGLAKNWREGAKGRHCCIDKVAEKMFKKNFTHEMESVSASGC
jgi:hypothetical protein